MAVDWTVNGFYGMAVTNNFPNALSLKQALGTGSGDITGGWYRPEWLSALIDLLIEKAMSTASGLLKMIPIFGQIYGSLAKLNSATLNLALMPTIALEFLMEIKEIVMDGFFHLHSVDSLEFWGGLAHWSWPLSNHEERWWPIKELADSFKARHSNALWH